MEFQAYPVSSAIARKDVRVLLRIQNVLHDTDSIVLPATLLVLGSVLPAYQHLSHADTSRTSVRNFLIKIMLQMLPLTLLSCKILRCADPVGLFARFSTKVMIMHFSFLALRAFSILIQGVDLEHATFNVAIFLASAVLLPTVFGLRLSPAGLQKHFETFLLALGALLVGIAEVSAFNTSSRFRFAEDLVLTSSDYIEILAFVPAVWMAYRRDGGSRELEGSEDVALTQKRALALFAFLAVFYSVEDVAHAVDSWKFARIATAAHVLHYLLLLDFAGFLLAHLCDPEKLRVLMGPLARWVADLGVV